MWPVNHIWRFITFIQPKAKKKTIIRYKESFYNLTITYIHEKIMNKQAEVFKRPQTLLLFSFLKFRRAHWSFSSHQKLGNLVNVNVQEIYIKKIIHLLDCILFPSFFLFNASFQRLSLSLQVNCNLQMRAGCSKMRYVLRCEALFLFYSLMDFRTGL